eukprot:TRINITY_DN5375_c0_g1_i6.p2 TRINITY_DN5375_c0_g1~~TRINITY_DN5375_c0_g1_i6.p2  ORF type:complete len:185 (-),score=-19.27 TRINITY_DN5375_c0_g1_i6:253-807(-)
MNTHINFVVQNFNFIYLFEMFLFRYVSKTFLKFFNIQRRQYFYLISVGQQISQIQNTVIQNCFYLVQINLEFYIQFQYRIYPFLLLNGLLTVYCSRFSIENFTFSKFFLGGSQVGKTYLPKLPIFNIFGGLQACNFGTLFATSIHQQIVILIQIYLLWFLPYQACSQKSIYFCLLLQEVVIKRD